jgi:Seven times multi-haem cytochrome CxxCH/PKD domain
MPCGMGHRVSFGGGAMNRYICVLVVGVCLGLLMVAAPAQAQIPPEGCIYCHEIVTPGIVTQYQSGAMGDGDATCVDCHGDDHQAITAEQGKVPASRCARCHARQYAEFTVKDGTGAYVNKHAQGWTRMVAGARYQVMPAAERYEMCERCHNVGYTYDDGSVGKCDSCHTRHVFSAEEAKEPAACGTCHMGPDHEQIDMWEKSKHGVVYTTEKERPGGDPGRAPTCVTCHQPEMVNGAGQPLTHNVSTNITYGTVAQGARLTGTPLSVPMRTMTESERATRRSRMLAVCDDCHSSNWAAHNLDLADQIKTDVDELLWDPVMRIRGLWYDGLLDPMPENRPPNPAYAAAGPNFVNGGYVLVLGGQQLYGDTSQIEQAFFTTYKYDHVSTFKGAYHINPDYSHWYGWSRVNQDRDIVAGQEAALRRGLDPGFTVTPARIVVGQAATFDASVLAAWGDSSPNTYAWSFGDKASQPADLAASVAHAYAVPGTYTVRLTCSDDDLVNNVLQPLSCSGKRTTTLTLRAKYGATLSLAKIARVRKGRQVTVKGTLTTGDASTALIELWAKTASGSWSRMATKTVATAAGVPLTVSFKRTLNARTTFRMTCAGDADTWDVTSSTRTVSPL